MNEAARSGQIPAFGDWDRANELPITQYFESARQAGLIRYTSSGEYMRGDLYAVDHNKPSQYHYHTARPSSRKARVVREKRGPVNLNNREQKRQGKVCEQKRQGKVCDATAPPNKPPPTKADAPPRQLTVRAPKPVDEDLYKIPPELLRSSKRKKLPGLFSCLVPACAS